MLSCIDCYNPNRVKFLLSYGFNFFKQKQRDNLNRLRNILNDLYSKYS